MRSARKSVKPPANAKALLTTCNKDEFYRQMFLLEEHRAGAETKLALVLLHTWLQCDASPSRGEDRVWLRKVSQISVEMIRNSLNGGNAADSCEH